LYNDLKDVLLTEEQISAKVKELGEIISRDYKGKDLLLVSVLKGSIIFMADLMRAITINANIDFLSVSSYGNEVKTSGVVKILKDLDVSIENKDVLVVEDILDSGLTLSYILGILSDRNPKSLKICTFLDKPERRKANIKADYSGFTVPDEFVVGYGLDYAEKYRNLPVVGILQERIYS